jgi:hypothetical protein
VRTDELGQLMQSSQGQVTARCKVGMEDTRSMVGRVADRKAEAAEREAEEARAAKLKARAEEVKCKAEAAWREFGAARVRLSKAVTEHEKVAAREARLLAWMVIKEARREAWAVESVAGSPL